MRIYLVLSVVVLVAAFIAPITVKATTVPDTECTCQVNPVLTNPQCTVTFSCDRLDGAVQKVTAGTPNQQMGGQLNCDNCPVGCPNLNPPPAPQNCTQSLSISYSENYQFDIQVGGNVTLGEAIKVQLSGALGAHYGGTSTYTASVNCGSGALPGCSKATYAATLQVYTGGKTQMQHTWRWMETDGGPNPPCTSQGTSVNTVCTNKTSSLTANYYSGGATCTTVSSTNPCNNPAPPPPAPAPPPGPRLSLAPEERQDLGMIR